MKRSCIAAIANLALAEPLAAASPATKTPLAKRETRCGWFANPTPGNASLTDADGEWLISEQGGYQADGDWPPTDKSWVHTNGGSYGYGCACITATTDRAAKRVVKIFSGKSLPMAQCEHDKKLKPIADAAAAAELPPTRESLGIAIGMKYDEAKKIFAAKGWVAGVEKETHPYPKYPEISCGSGKDAICSVSYTKGEDAIALLIKESTGKGQSGPLIVGGDYD